MEKDKRKETNDKIMILQLIGGIIVIFILVLFLIPTVDVLTIGIRIPPPKMNPADNDITLLQNKITFIQQQLSTNLLKNVTRGEIPINITLEDSSKKHKFNKIYYVDDGSWIIATFQPISNGDIVTFEMPTYGFRKVIIVGNN